MSEKFIEAKILVFRFNYWRQSKFPGFLARIAKIIPG